MVVVMMVEMWMMYVRVVVVMLWFFGTEGDPAHLPSLF
jgi:hypothetical protein